MDDPAQDCTRCGEMKASDEFSPRQRICKACRAAQARKARTDNPTAHRKAQRAWYARNAEREREARRERYAAAPEEGVDASRRDYLEKKAKTAPLAKNHGKRWTGPELEIAADETRSEVEVALVLGRTAEAVGSVRHRIRTEPLLAHMAGTRRTNGR